MRTKFTYADPFHLKEISGEGANHHMVTHHIAVIYSSTFGEDWWLMEGGVCEQRNMIFSLSLRYGGNRKSSKNPDGTVLNLIWAQ